MKIIGIACSPRKGKTTAHALEVCLKAVHADRKGLTESMMYKLSLIHI